MAERTLVLDPELDPTGGVVLTQVDAVRQWCQKNSLWPLPLGLACCAIEFMATAASRFDMARFGMEVMRFSPRQADLMIVSGWLTYKMAEVMTRLYDQMAEPKWVVSMGACASSGGMHRSYPVVQGIDEFLPVDMYIPGCPPRPEAVLNALIHLQAKIGRSRPTVAVERSNGSAGAGPGGLDTRSRSGEMTPPVLYVPGDRWYEGHKPDVGVRRDHGPANGYDGARGYLSKALDPAPRARRDAGEGDAVIDAVAPDAWRDAVDARRQEGFDFLLDLTAVDHPARARRFTIVAILGRSAPYGQVLLETTVGEGEAVPTLCEVYAAANWAEREIFDMFGIPFDGHPDLTRILLPREFEGWPLRKDFPCEGHLRFRD